MKTSLLIFNLLFLSTLSYGQDRAKNIVLISLDGYRWQEIFHGADSALIFSKNTGRRIQLRFLKNTGPEMPTKEEKS